MTPAGLSIFPFERQRTQTLVMLLVDSANKILKSRNIFDVNDARAIIEDHDLVYGVWQQRTGPPCVGIHVIEGEWVLESDLHDSRPPHARLVGLPCRNFEEADRLRTRFGDGGTAFKKLTQRLRQSLFFALDRPVRTGPQPTLTRFSCIAALHLQKSTLYMSKGTIQRERV